ncbi:protein virilizer homolog isoform X2 [Halichondria panicea]|uniref:protein virilizer homolog isoform X2 n=1 Tax=Halichondria panicea TaxID=6063 RepID=UPI00312B36D3
MGSSEKELLFYETFDHSASEGELHVDLVRFSTPAMVREVRVVPPGQRVHSAEEINKIGETTPSTFTLSVYVNDSTNPLAPTFDPVGSVDYQSDAVALSIKPKTSSDMLVVSGLYNTLTICIYGNVAPPPSTTSPFGPSSPSRNRRGSPYSDSYSDDRSRSASPGRGEVKEGGFDLFEPFSPVNSPDHLFDLSDDDMGGEKRSATGYEEFSDDEITFDDHEFDNQEGAEPSFLYSEAAWLTSGSGFNPYQCNFTKLESYPVMSETPHESLLLKLQRNEGAVGKRGTVDEASRLRDIIAKTKDVTQPQKWVEMLEEIPTHLYPGLAQLQKKSTSDGKEVMQKLVTWTLQCLSMDHIGELPIMLNIRSLKAGLRMVTSVASLGRKCAHAFIKHGVIDRLSYLLLADSMASSLKLMALRALDNLIDYPQGMEQLLGWSSSEFEGDTTYQLLLQLALTKPSVRVMKALGALLSKAHIYELLGNLQQLTAGVVSVTPVKTAPSNPDDDFWNVRDEEGVALSVIKEEADNGVGSMEVDKTVESAEVEQMDAEESCDIVTGQSDVNMEEGGGQLEEDTVLKIVQCLEELRKCIETSQHTIVQPSTKSFPTQTRCFPESDSEYYSSLVRMFQARRLLECLLILLTAPSAAVELRVFSAVRELLLYFMSSLNGLLFLSGSPGVMNILTRALIQTVDTEMPLSAMQPLPEYLTADGSDSCTAQNLGLLLTFHIQILQSMDVLKKSPKLNMADLESPDTIGALHTLYSMTLTPIGKHAVAGVLALGDSVTALLPFVEPWSQREHDHKLKRSSVSSRYAAVLILQLLQSQVRGDFLISYGSRLLTVADFFKGEDQRDLKWVEAVIVLFSSGVLDTLVTLLDKFSETFLPLWGQQVSLSVTNAGILCTLVSLTLKVVKVVLVQLLSDGDYQYQDMRVVTALLRVHMVLCSAPQSSVVSHATPEIQSLMVDILTLCTKPELLSRDPSTPPDVRQSCWCLMLEEVFKHTLTSPHCFLSGLIILSELLPLPLPVQAPQDVDESAMTFVLSARREWVEHLEPFNSEIMEVLETLLPSGTTPLQQALRRFCAQLVDLSLNFALSVTGHVIQNTIAEIEKHLEQPEGSEVSMEEEEATTDNKKTSSSGVLRTLTMCAVLCQQPVFKVGVVQLLRESGGVPRFIPLLLFMVQRKESTLQAKLSVMSILNALCNVYLYLVPASPDDGMDAPPIQMGNPADCLPTHAQLESITSAVFGHVTSPDQPLATVLGGLKVILCLCQHNMGLQHVYSNLSANISGLTRLLERIQTTIRGSSPPPPDSLGCVSLFLDLLNALLSCQISGLVAKSLSEGVSREVVTVMLPKPLLKTILITSNGDNLLNQLKEELQEHCKDDESLLNEFVSIISDLSEQFDPVNPSPVDLSPLEPEPSPDMQLLEAQFEQRSAVVLSAAQHTADPDYWLASPPHDESELEPEAVTTDLSQLASESCANFNLEEELKKHLLPSPPRTPPLKRKKITFTGPEAQKRLKEAMEMRIKSGRSNLFRSRKQNTSRPPSMHVDDFMRADVSRSGRGFGLERGRLGGPQVPYMPPSMYMPHMGGDSSGRIVTSNSRWVSHVPPGMNYRREVGVGGGAMRTSWGDFMTSAHMKQMSSLRSGSVWSNLQAYSRTTRGLPAGGRSVMWPPSSDPWKGSSARQVYKRPT